MCGLLGGLVLGGLVGCCACGCERENGHCWERGCGCERRCDRRGGCCGF